MKQAIRKNLPSFAAIIGLVAIALAVGYYIVQQQRLRIPLLEEEPFQVNVALSTAQAVTPGQGQTAQVAGVKIGKIQSVELEDGRAIVELGLDQKYRDLIHTDAKALLRPRTGLKDMYIQIFPGSADKPLIEEGFTIPVANTLTDVDLHDILAELDERTREYVQLFAHGTARGLKGNGEELAEVFERFGPTFRDISRVNRAVAREREDLRSAISALAAINERLAERPEDLTELVDTSAAVFEAFASEDDDLRSTISELAPTLEQATQTLRAVRPFARELGPTTRALVPVMQALLESNRVVRPFARDIEPVVRGEIRPFVRASRPLVRNLAPAAEDLARAFPELNRDLRVFNRLFNMLAFNPDGAEGPEKKTREEGFLFWLAWTLHQTVNLQNIQDANGPLRPLFLTGTCGTLTSLVNDEPELEFALGLSPLLETLCESPNTRSVNLKAARKEADAILGKGEAKK